MNSPQAEPASELRSTALFAAGMVIVAAYYGKPPASASLYQVQILDGRWFASIGGFLNDGLRRNLSETEIGRAVLIAGDVMRRTAGRRGNDLSIRERNILSKIGGDRFEKLSDYVVSLLKQHLPLVQKIADELERKLALDNAELAALLEHINGEQTNKPRLQTKADRGF